MRNVTKFYFAKSFSMIFYYTVKESDNTKFTIYIIRNSK